MDYAAIQLLNTVLLLHCQARVAVGTVLRARPSSGRHAVEGNDHNREPGEPTSAGVLHVPRLARTVDHSITVFSSSCSRRLACTLLCSNTRSPLGYHSPTAPWTACGGDRTD
jgi:hypothetical protein